MRCQLNIISITCFWRGRRERFYVFNMKIRLNLISNFHYPSVCFMNLKNFTYNSVWILIWICLCIMKYQFLIHCFSVFREKTEEIIVNNLQIKSWFSLNIYILKCLENHLRPFSLGRWVFVWMYVITFLSRRYFENASDQILMKLGSINAAFSNFGPIIFWLGSVLFFQNCSNNTMSRAYHAFVVKFREKKKREAHEQP